MNRILAYATVVLVSHIGFAQSKAKPLSDAALHEGTAGGVAAGISHGVIKLQGSVPTVNWLVIGAGTLAVLTGPLKGTNVGSLTLTEVRNRISVH
ncbi:MAG: hypothetical protein M3Y50_04840 [Acidobacteriota bacterium]|nr:hypothetical protein [Acidobacteriota bacterium]